MSPDFVNMRHLGKDAPSVTPEGKRGGDGAMQAAPTDQIFDKADKAQALSSRQAELGKLETEFAAAKGEERKALQTRLDRLRAHVAYLERLVDEEDAH